MKQAVKGAGLGCVALCAGVLLMPGSVFAQYYDDPIRPGRPVYGGPPPTSSGRAVRLSQYEVRDLVRGLGYRRVSEPVLNGRHYVVTATEDGAPVAIRVDAYSGRVVDVQPLIYGRGAPEGYYPPEAVPPAQGRGRGQGQGQGQGQWQSGRGPVPLPPARPEALPYEGDVATPAQPGAVSPDPEGYVPEIAADPAQGEPPHISTMQPQEQAERPVEQAQPQAVPQVTPAAPARTVAAAQPPAPALPQDIGAGVGTPATGSAGTASVLSRPVTGR